MTIPISPGPFSFLESIGSGLGEIGKRRDEVADQKRKQAQEQAGLILALIRDKVAKPETLDHPAFQQALQGMGLGGSLGSQDIQTDPQADMLRQLFSQYNAGQTMTPEQQQTMATGRLPGPYDIATDKAKLEDLQAQPALRAAQAARATADSEKLAKQTELMGKETDYQRQQVEIAAKRLGMDATEIKSIETDDKGNAVGVTNQGKLVPLGFKALAKTTGAGAVGLKPLPTPILTAVTDQQGLLSDIDAAIAELKADPNAVGPIKGHLPGFIANIADPQGVAARGALQRVRSANLHKLYGSRLTATEIQQTSQLHPATTDTPKAALVKLNAMRERVAKHNDDYFKSIPKQYDVTQFEGAPIGGAAPAGDALDQQAADAIAKGADPDKVKARLAELRKGQAK